MRWEPPAELSHTDRLSGLVPLRVFRWGNALSGISDDPRLPFPYVLVLFDTTEPESPQGLWFVFATPQELREAEHAVLRFGDERGVLLSPKSPPPTLFEREAWPKE